MRLVALAALVLSAGVAFAQDAPPPQSDPAAAAAPTFQPAQDTSPGAQPDTAAPASVAEPQRADGAAPAADPGAGQGDAVGTEPAEQTTPQTGEAAPTPSAPAAPRQPAAAAGAASPAAEAVEAQAPAAGGSGEASAPTAQAPAPPADPAASPAAETAGAPPGVTGGARPLAIGLLTDAPPFSSAARYGVRVGFDVDLAYGICARLERACRYLPMTRAELAQALRDRRIDAVIASDGRSQIFDTIANFSIPYLSLAARFVVPRSSASDLESEGATAYGAVLGTPHAQYLQATYKDPSAIALYANADEMWIDLALGRLQGALATAVTARLEFLDTPLGSQFRFASGSLADAKVRVNEAAIAVRKGDATLLEQLNKALADYMNSAEYAEALNRHLTGGLATRPNGSGRT